MSGKPGHYLYGPGFLEVQIVTFHPGGVELHMDASIFLFTFSLWAWHRSPVQNDSLLKSLHLSRFLSTINSKGIIYVINRFTSVVTIDTFPLFVHGDSWLIVT